VQALRATHQAELKKKEKEVEKMADKWAKLSDAQAKLSSLPSGFKSSNSRTVTGGAPVSKGSSLLEVAAQEAEKARVQITTECTGLKRVVLNAVNELQEVLHLLRDGDEQEVRLLISSRQPLISVKAHSFHSGHPLPILFTGARE
jgi:hypothetical protein